jgi:hypothetical protein
VDGEHKKHMEVSYIGNFDGAIPLNTAVVESDGDYVRACASLARSDDPGHLERVWVRRRNHFSWLKDFAEQTRLSLSFTEKTARSILGDLWRVSVPDWLTDEAVIEERLLEFEVASDHPSSFDTRILVHFFGEVFEKEVLNPSDLSDLLPRLASRDSDRLFEQYPSLRHSLNSKCITWQDKTKEQWLRKLSTMLANTSEQAWKELTCLVLLRDYPARLLEFVTPPDRVPFLRSIPAEALADLPLHSAGIDDSVSQIDIFFKDVAKEVSSGADCQKILARTSGRVRQEFAHLSSILQSANFTPNEEMIQSIREKFRNCPGLTEGQLRSLKRFVVPQKPSAKNPDENWGTQQWLAWALNEYIPYRHWQTVSRHYDKDVEDTVKAFTDWYTSEYVAVHHDPNLSLLNCLNALASGADKVGLSIVLVIDCLPIAFFPLLDDAMRDVELSRHNLGYRFAPLPTVTEYSKRRLLKGSWDVLESDYKKLLDARSKDDWGGTSISYLSSLKDLTELKAPEDPSIVVLNLITADEILHKDLESENLTHEEELGRLFTRLAETLRAFVDSWKGDPEKLAIHVVTDHAATRTLDEEQTTLDSSVVVKLFDDEKHRFARITKSESHEVPANLWELGYRFEDPFSVQPCVFFLPRGHNTVKSNLKTGVYTHGGATPEEVIVPCCLYKPVQAKWEKPLARFINLNQNEKTGRAWFYILRIVPIEVELYNPNSAEIQVVRCSVAVPENGVKNFTRPHIAGEQRAFVRIDCYFNKSALGERDLELEIVYEIAGETKVLEMLLPSEFRSAMTGGFSLKDL